MGCGQTLHVKTALKQHAYRDRFSRKKSAKCINGHTHTPLNAHKTKKKSMFKSQTLRNGAESTLSLTHTHTTKPVKHALKEL